MISKMQGVLEQCKELEINLVNAKDLQMSVEGIINSMDVLFDVW